MKLGRALTLVLGFSASELRAKVFSLEETKFLKRKTVDPLNANEQDKSPHRHHFRIMNHALKVKKIVFERQSFHYVNENSEQVRIEYNSISSLKVQLNVDYISGGRGVTVNHNLLINILLNDGTSNILEYVDYDIIHSATNFPVLFNIIDYSNNIPNFSYEITCTPRKNLNTLKAIVEYYVRYHKLIPWYKLTFLDFKNGNIFDKISIIILLIALVAIVCSFGMLLYTILLVSL